MKPREICFFFCKNLEKVVGKEKITWYNMIDFGGHFTGCMA
jgi:hypothetical protein